MEKACVDFLKERLGADNAFMLLTQVGLTTNFLDEKKFFFWT